MRQTTETVIKADLRCQEYKVKERGEREIAMELKKTKLMRKNNENGREHKKDRKRGKRKRGELKHVDLKFVDNLKPTTRHSKCLTPLTEVKMSTNIDS